MDLAATGSRQKTSPRHRFPGTTRSGTAPPEDVHPFLNVAFACMLALDAYAFPLSRRMGHLCMTCLPERHAIIIGGGASGVLLAYQLLQHPDADFRVTLIESAPRSDAGWPITPAIQSTCSTSAPPI
jgi:hypothetical protein